MHRELRPRADERLRQREQQRVALDQRRDAERPGETGLCTTIHEPRRARPAAVRAQTLKAGMTSRANARRFSREPAGPLSRMCSNPASRRTSSLSRNLVRRAIQRAFGGGLERYRRNSTARLVAICPASAQDPQCRFWFASASRSPCACPRVLGHVEAAATARRPSGSNLRPRFSTSDLKKLKRSITSCVGAYWSSNSLKPRSATLAIEAGCRPPIQIGGCGF